jgi:hypothetical protein
VVKKLTNVKVETHFITIQYQVCYIVSHTVFSLFQETNYIKQSFTFSPFLLSFFRPRTK